ncbi:polymorphic toxin-type HINT domain-containing protein [Kitasatospora sp. NPDC052896]|uniref:polymorphic toxin-type HINT domain-containing protein n=1 Tax=Kitasatospora sp. NPDC052896 TaxID=3364061 RepID=UPI0037C7533B
MAPRQAASAAGVNGVLLSVQRDDASGAAGPAHVSLSYSQFQNAFGGDWGSRLGLVQLPACALTTPTVAACRTETPVGFHNDVKNKTLEADVTVPPATQGAGKSAPMAAAASEFAAVPTAAPMVLAATATSSSSAGGGGGDFTATSLKPSGSWQAGGAADSFDWSYPLPTPSVPGGLTPDLGLSYDSQSQDGLTSSTNNQASEVGDGWQLPQSFIERSYASCSQNPAGPTQTSDNCWSNNNTLTLSFNGSTTTLVKDDATGTYRAQDDSNDRIEYLTGASNGAQNGEYFRVTTTDGTQYYFGLNQLPGFASGDATTNSVWTEPVYATASGQPCYNATFANSWCQQAYRWNLDYVVDTHSDAVSYFYNTEQNYYAADLGTTATALYTRGGYLSKIQYGQRAGQVYSTQPAGQVLFTVNGRCNTSPTGCATSTLNSSTASSWPDIPYDLNCASGVTCQMTAPSFWSEYMLTGIQTQALVGSTETNVDSWALTYSFPATGDSTTPSLWLSSITHTGQDTSAGGSSSAISLPAVTFTGTPLSNRVNVTNGYPPITRQRLTGITTETGETITVNYSAPACASGTPSDASQNTSLCFPDYWTPTGQNSPMLDWFNKFIVTHVTEQDPTGGSANDTIVTSYTPVGTPAWHYDDDPLTASNERSWDQWRGYQGMIVSTGTAPDPVTKTQYTYFQGMNGDTLPNSGTRTATVSDSRGDPAVTDSNQFAGQTYETQVLNGSAIVTDTITDPWTSSATATHALTGGLPSQQAFLTGTADTKVYTPLASGATRTTETDYTHDAYGRVTATNDQGDTSTTADDLCTTASYADNTSAWILDKPAESRTVSVNCSTTPTLPANAVSDDLTFYDSSTTLGAAPTVGDPTMTQKVTSYNGSTPVYTTEQTTTIDQYGRPTAALDALNRKTTTTYTPATGAEPTSIAVTDPMSHTTTTSYDPLRDLPLTKTDPAAYVTTEQYDALGRLTTVYEPGQAAPNPPNLKYTYTVSNTGPSVVDTYTLNDDTSYRQSETLYDAMLRARETQTQTVDGGRTISDTMYDTDGWQSETTDPYYNSSAVSTSYVQAQVGQVPSETGYSYDAAGRRTASIAYALGTQTWQTTTSYGGNFTTTVPPAGQTATTTVTDARGQQTDLIQYKSGVPTDYVNDPASDYTDTKYTYTPAGKQATETDPAGNSWSWNYNLLGQQTDAYDPDTGHTQSSYDAAGQLISSTDPRGSQTTTAYDLDGRKTATYDTTSTQTLSSTNKLAAWTYDTVKKGLPTSTTSYSAGDTYTTTVLAYNNLAKPAATRMTLTGEGTALVPTSGYVTSYGYSLTGNLTNQGDPAEGGLPAENIAYGYDQFGEPTSLTSNGGASWDYVNAVGYSEYGQPLQYTFGTSTGEVWSTYTYDPQTRNITDIQTSASTVSGTIDDLNYAYGNSTVSKGAGLLTSTTDKQNADTTVDTQCYQYDYATRIQQAWTATDNCTATPAPGNSGTVGGPVAPYWQSWTYDAAGNRTTQTDHDTTGNTTNDTTTSYQYPTAGSTTDQPHTLTSTTATGPNAAANTASYTYDASGNTTAINGGTLGNQTLTWTDQDKLATDTTTAGTTSYVYDADGNQLLRRDPGTTTLYAGDAQLALNTTSQTVSGTRYYTINGQAIAARTSTGTVDYLAPDRQGTDQLTINSTTQAVTRRQYLPFGQTRGTTPTTWPGDTGYVGGHNDTTTNLETLGARLYDPTSGRFLSPDPILETTDPTQTNGYDYAGNDPVTESDPTGQCPADLCGIGTPIGGTGSSPSNPTRYVDTGPEDPDNPDAGEVRHGVFTPTSHRSSSGKSSKPSFNGATCSRFGVNCSGTPKALTGRTPKVVKTGGLVFGSVVLTGVDALQGGADPVTDAADVADIDALIAEFGDDAASDAGTGTSGACSFTPDTKVLMANGSGKPIDDLIPGDQVEAADPTNGHDTGARTVTDTWINHDDDLVDLELKLKNGTTETVHTTSNHPFWDDTTHTWVPAGQLTAGHALASPKGEQATVQGIRTRPGVADMYNLTVAQVHTYYVLAGTTPVLVHNCNTNIPNVALGTEDHGLEDFANDNGYTHFMGETRDGALANVGDVANYHPETQIHVRLDGFKMTSGKTGATNAELFDDAVKQGQGDNWYTTQREMAILERGYRFGNLEPSRLTFYMGGVDVTSEVLAGSKYLGGS